ncbi:MAG TPA: TetR family transcriptional regulator [Trebonia sp.]|nr:TetR family transcriptional regulator [Trebonia sp.]
MTSSRQPDGGLPDETERIRLTRAAVVDRALALADESGLDGLTIRKLATDLGVTPMALYWHFRGKEELIAGLADRIWGEIDVTLDSSAPWTEQVRRMLGSLLTVLRTHPAAPALLLRMEDKLHSEASLRVTEVTLDVLRRAGFGPADASALARHALWTGIALVMSEPGIEERDDAERAELQRRKQVELASLPPARYPRLVECAVPMTAWEDPETHYRFGVDLFVAGLAAMAAARAQGEQGSAPPAVTP